MSTRRRRGAVRAPAARVAAAAMTTGALALSACGSAQPLKGFTSTQRSQLDFAWSAVINATDTADLTELDRASRAKALYAACKPLDKSNAVLSALSDVCRPLYINKKLDGALAAKCGTPTAVCKRALLRNETAAKDVATALANLNTQAAHIVTDVKCRLQITTTQPEIDAYTKLAAAYSVMSLGVDQRAKDVMSLGRSQMQQSLLLTVDSRTAAQRMSDFRDACGLNNT